MKFGNSTFRFNYSDGTHFNTSVSIWYPFFKTC